MGCAIRLLHHLLRLQLLRLRRRGHDAAADVAAAGGGQRQQARQAGAAAAAALLHAGELHPWVLLQGRGG